MRAGIIPRDMSSEGPGRSDSAHAEAHPAPASPGARTGALDGVLVVDASEGVAGGYAGRLLADLGAEVVKVEPPSGDRLRALGPFPGDSPDIEAGGLHLALNAGKRSLVLDLESGEGRERLRALAAQADILLEGAGPGVMEGRDLGPERLLEANPQLVYASHSPFGLTGPYARRVTSEIVDWAMGGYLYFGGDPGRSPIMVHGHQAELHAGMQLAAGALAALWHVRRTGAGQHLEVSTLESVLNAHVWLTTSWTHEGLVQTRDVSMLTPCADGHVIWMGMRNPDIFVLIERPDLRDDPRWTTPEGWREAIPEIRALFAEWAREHSRDEICEQGQTLRLAITGVNGLEELAHSRQLRERGWWRETAHPELGSLLLPGPPWVLSGTPAGPAGPAPRLDADAGYEPPPRESGEFREGARDALPLEGIKVLEITGNWSGPLTGRHLGDLGADVVKIELARRPATRVGHFAGSEGWETPHNRSGYFNLFNRNKRDLCLDLGTERGREIFLQLAADADVVLENNSARVFPQLGLGYETLAQHNPRVVMCSITGFGATGPERDHLAFGSNIEASCGLMAQTGYGDGVPQGTGSYYADPITGAHATVGILAALFARERTGSGQWLDMALQESAAAFLTESIMDYRLNGRVARPRGNRSPRIAPQGVYRSLGTDCWLAIGVESDEQWRALCATIERPDLAGRLPTREERLGAHDEIDAAIEAWSEMRDHNRAAALLQEAGVPAGPVLANWEIVSDPHLHERGYFVDIVHPDTGHHRWDGFPWRLSRTPASVRRHSPLFAEHTDEVLGELGLSLEEIVRLRDAEVIGYEPRYG